MTLEHLYHKPCLSAREVFDGLRKQRDAIAPYVGTPSNSSAKPRPRESGFFLKASWGP